MTKMKFSDKLRLLDSELELKKMQKYFYTKNNIKVPAVTTEQMIEIDRIAIEETGPNLYQMM